MIIDIAESDAVLLVELLEIRRKISHPQFVPVTSVKVLIHQTNNQSINQSTLKKSINQSIDRSLNGANNQSNNQSIGRSTVLLIDSAIDRLTKNIINFRLNKHYRTSPVAVFSNRSRALAVVLSRGNQCTSPSPRRTHSPKRSEFGFGTALRRFVTTWTISCKTWGQKQTQSPIDTNPAAAAAASKGQCGGGDISCWRGTTIYTHTHRM